MASAVEKLIKQAVEIRTKVNASKAKRTTLPMGRARTKMYEAERVLLKQVMALKAKIAAVKAAEAKTAKKK